MINPRSFLVGGLVSLLAIGGCYQLRQDSYEKNESNEPTQEETYSPQETPYTPPEQSIQKESITGVEGFNTPEEILANENVRDAVEFLQKNGYQLNLSHELYPENLEGMFEPRQESFQIMPNPYAGGILSFLALRVENQTPDNYIEVARLQKDTIDDSDEQTVGRTIIRGDDSKFIIYSIQDVQAGNYCQARRVWIIDGTKDESGNLTTLDLRIPVDTTTPDCVFPTFAESISYAPLKK